MRLRRTPRTPTRDPLLPVEAVVTISLWFLVVVTALFVLFGAIALASDGDTAVSIAGVGDESTCASLDSYAGDASGVTGPGTRSGEFVAGIRDDARYSVAGWEVCLEDPSLTQAAAGDARELGATVSFLAVALLLRRAVRGTRRDGLFAPATTRTVRALGWTLLGVALLLPVVLNVADAVVLSAAIEGRTWYGDLDRLDLSWSLLVTALGVITVARVLDHAVALQEEAELTV